MPATGKRRALGQHFLRDHAVARAIVDLVGPTRADLVVEIGPGQGALTALLAERAGVFFALEIDEELGVQPPIPPGSSISDEARWVIIHDRAARRSGIEASWGEERVSAGTVRLREGLRVKATIGDDDPDSASVEAGARFTLTRPDVHVVTEAAGRFWSVPSAFRCELKLDVWLGGEPFASRAWESEVERDLV